MEAVILNEGQIDKLLRWDQVIPALRQSIIAITCTNLSNDQKKENVKDLMMVNPQRIFMNLPSEKGTLLCMPGYVEGFNLSGSDQVTKETALGCKILYILNDKKENPTLPTITGYMYLFDEKNGKLLAMLGGERITEWRTAAVSCIATNLLWSKAKTRTDNEKRILGIFGSGVQGRIHAYSLHHHFHFTEIRIWNRTIARAEKLVAELNEMFINCNIILCQTAETCARDADVIVTATSAKSSILEEEWVKPGAIINVVGPLNEIVSTLYDKADVYVASLEVSNLEQPELKVVGELGQLELGLIKKTDDPEKIQIFQLRGMGIFDAVMARLIYNNWTKNQNMMSENHNI